LSKYDNLRGKKKPLEIWQLWHIQKHKIKNRLYEFALDFWGSPNGKNSPKRKNQSCFHSAIYKKNKIRLNLAPTDVHN
jgi:hypothetical protein